MKKLTPWVLPPRFSHVGEQQQFAPDELLGQFPWQVQAPGWRLDFSKNVYANHQSLALLLPWMWLQSLQGSELEVINPGTEATGGRMWLAMKANGWKKPIQNGGNLGLSATKPTLAIRSYEDAECAKDSLAAFLDQLDDDRKNALTHIVKEVLFNAYEHGVRLVESLEGVKKRVPAVFQASWHVHRRQLSVMIGDVGPGIRAHLAQSYGQFASDEDAIRHALDAKTSGTFGSAGGYMGKNNQGMGLFVSSELLKQLDSQIHLVSGHASASLGPQGLATTRLDHPWPGTLVFLDVSLPAAPGSFVYQQAMSHILTRASERAAQREKQPGPLSLQLKNFVVSDLMTDKGLALMLRDRHILPALDGKRSVVVDFEGIQSATHSAMFGLLGEPFAKLGPAAFKSLKFRNVSQELREMIDFIYDQQT